MTTAVTTMRSSASYRRIRRVSRIALYGATALALILAGFPFYWLVITSVKIGQEVATYPPVYIPSQLSLENYVQVFQAQGVGQFLLNSLIVASASTILVSFLGALAAYALSKSYLSFRIRQAVMVWILVTRIFPPITTAIPYYIIIKSLQLSDTYFALILTYVSLGLPFVIWLMLGFFQDLPREIEKAAEVDGCGLWQRFVQVVLPLTLPGLAVTAIFAFILSWNEFLYASMLTSYNAKTLPVVISGYISDKYLRWGEMSAMGSLMVIPVLIFASATQRYLVRGLTFGAVKG